MAKEIKYKIDNLFIAHIGIKSSGTTYSKETIICKRKKDGYEHYFFTDIFTNNTYPSISYYMTKVGESVAFNQMPLISTLKPSDFKDQLLKKRYITTSELIALYDALNADNGYVMTIEKLKLDEPSEITVMNKKKYLYQQTYLREEELKQLMISLAMNKKTIVITGDPGIGKTALVDQLAYLIQHNQVPDFLKNQPIYEINVPKLNLNKKKNLETSIKEIIDYAKNKDAILFLDDVDEILEPNENNINTIALIKYAAERENLKIILTTSSEQENILNNDKFDLIKLPELSEQELIEIANQHIKNKSLETNISTNKIKEHLNEIIQVLIGSTISSSINFITKQKNPGLLINLIDNSFANAQINKEKQLSLDNFITSIENNNNLDKNQSNKASNILKEIKKLNPQTEETKKLILSIKNT